MKRKNSLRLQPPLSNSSNIFLRRQFITRNLNSVMIYGLAFCKMNYLDDKVSHERREYAISSNNV